VTDVESVLVTGATGNQGGAVAEHLLASDVEFEVYGLTRDATGDRARELEGRGVEMVEGDLNDLETLRPAVSGVDAVFAVTNFWTEGYDRQVRQGKNIAEAAKAEGVSQFVAATRRRQVSRTSTPRGRSNSTRRTSTSR